MPIIQKSMDNIHGLNSSLSALSDRLTNVEQNVFQQADEPTVGVNQGDIWYDFTTDIIKVYREYPINTGSYRWEPLLFQNDDVIDGGTW